MMHTATHIVICDDERAEVDYLSALVKKWASHNGVEVQLNDFPSAESFLFAYEGQHTDILLLDIEMGAMDGVSLARKVRKSNKEVQIIFVTGYMEYIADGYEVEALHYLLKPVSEEKLNAVLNRALEKLARNEKALIVSHGGENIRIPLYEIRYLEVLHNHVTIYAEEPYRVKKTLAALEQELDNRFFRAGRSFIVNLRFVRKSTKTEIHMTDGTIIPLPRGLYNALNQAIISRL